MNSGPTVFSQVVAGLDATEVARAAARYPMPRASRTLSAYDHFAAMVFGDVRIADQCLAPGNTARDVGGGFDEGVLGDGLTFWHGSRMTRRQAIPQSVITQDNTLNDANDGLPETFLYVRVRESYGRRVIAVISGCRLGC